MRSLAAGSLASFLALLACAPALAVDQEVEIPQGQRQFAPEHVAVKPGEMVTWNNQDTGDQHNVHFDDGSFDEPPTPIVGPWTRARTFNAEGVFPYYCEMHGGPGGAGMSGVVYVNPTGTVPPLPPSASFTVTPSAALIGQVVRFDASGSSDPEGSITKHEWDLDGNGSYETDTGASPTVSRAYPGPALLTIKLRVTDAQALTDEASRTLLVGAARSGPVIATVASAPPRPSFASTRRTIRVSAAGRFSFGFRAAPGLNGRVTLRSVRKVTVSARRRVSLGTKRFTVPGSGNVRVRMKLSRRNLRILRRNRRIRFRATVTLRNSTGLTRTASTAITLKKPR